MRCFGWGYRPTPLGPVNYIPLAAIRASRKARIDADREPTSDKFSQEKVAVDSPSDREVARTPPDDQVFGG